MTYQANDKDTCLFCLGEAESSQPLQENRKCPCKYYYHDTCYVRYDRKDICPICKRIDSGIVSVQPSTQQEHIILTVTLPIDTIATPYTPLQTAPPIARKITLPHIICIIVTCAIIIAVMIAIIDTA